MARYQNDSRSSRSIQRTHKYKQPMSAQNLSDLLSVALRVVELSSLIIFILFLLAAILEIIPASSKETFRQSLQLGRMYMVFSLLAIIPFLVSTVADTYLERFKGGMPCQRLKQ